MTYLFHDSFATHPVGNQVPGDIWAHSHTSNVVRVGTGRDGTSKSMICENNQFVETYSQTPVPSSAFESVFLGLSVKIGLPLTTRPLVALYRAGRAEMLVDVGPSGTLFVYNHTTLRAQSVAGALSFDEWHTLELHHLSDNSVGRYEVRIDGQTVIDFDGDTRHTSAGDVAIRLFHPAAAPGKANEFSNVYFCNDQGATFNGFQGDVRFTAHTLQDTAQSDFTDNGSGASSADRITGSPIDESAFLSSDVVGHRDEFTISPLPANVSQILGVGISSFAKKDGGGPRSIRTALVSGPAEASFDTSLGDSFTRGSAFIESDPDTGSGWDIAGVDALRVAVEIAS